MQSSFLRLSSTVSLVALFAAQLGGCQGEEDCGTNCAGVSGAGSIAGSGVTAAGSSPVAGSATTVAGSGGAGVGVAGSAAVAGNTSVAGSGQVGVSGSGNTGGGGSGNSAGGSMGGQSQGGNGSGGASGGSGGAGGTGVIVDPITVGQCKDDYWPPANNGSVTRYDFVQGTSLPACAYVITHKGAGRDGDWDTVEGISTGDGGYFGAMNTTDFQQGAACGACVEATYSGRKVVLTIVDECPVSTNPKCVKGHIDLSRKAIRQLEPNQSLEDVRGVNWKYVKCPAAGNAKVRLHPNQNANWQPVVIENGLYPLKSVTLNGVNASRTGNNQGGNAWIATGQKAPYTVKATDVNNNAITFSYSGGTDLKDTGLQFKCQ